jgi:membrane-bound lytic murein transglycosylase MltF
MRAIHDAVSAPSPIRKDRPTAFWLTLAAACLAALLGLLVPMPSRAQDGTETLQVLPLSEHWTGDLDGMRDRKQIRILVPFSKTFFFVDKGGRQSGITYDVGRAFEEWLNKRDKAKTLTTTIVFIPVPRDRLLPGLLEGMGDIAAGNLTITDARQKLVQFSDPFAKDIREILVTGPTASPVASIDDLAGHDMYLRPSSSYFEHMAVINQVRTTEQKDPIPVIALDEELEDEDVLEMINSGLLPWTIVDEHKAKLWAPIYTSLAVRSDIAIRTGGEIAWAMRKDSPQLLAVVNEFVASHKIGTTFGNILKKRYLGNKSPVYRATSPEELAKFADLAAIFKQYGELYSFDQLMLAAQGYQESKLDQKARSPRGAVGVMQLLPTTAADPSVGITGIEHDAEQNIHAGAKYLRLLVDKYLDDPALDDKNRTLMAFAAYNAGPGNLRKFRKRAAESGLDQNIWFGNVEHAAAEIVGRETVQYVANIYKYYVAYRMATERNRERSAAKDSISTTP